MDCHWFPPDNRTSSGLSLASHLNAMSTTRILKNIPLEGQVSPPQLERRVSPLQWDNDRCLYRDRPSKPLPKIRPSNDPTRNTGYLLDDSQLQQLKPKMLPKPSLPKKIRSLNNKQAPRYCFTNRDLEEIEPNLFSGLNL